MVAKRKDGQLDLTQEQLDLLKSLLHRFLPGVTVWAYGSRVTGQSRPASDLDLVVFTDSGQAAFVSELREAFEESNLPFRVDLFEWENLPDSFKANIQARNVVLQS